MSQFHFTHIATGAIALAAISPAFAQLSASLDQPLHIPDASALAPSDTITITESGASIRVDAGLNQALIDKITPLADGDYGRLLIGGNVSSGLDFTGKGNFVLQAYNDDGFTFSGPWTPGTFSYHVAGGGLSFTGANTFTDGSSARSVNFSGFGHTPTSILAGNNHSGGTYLSDGAQLLVKANNGLGTGSITLTPSHDSAVTAVAIEGADKELANPVHVAPGGAVDGGAVLIVREGARYSGTATFSNVAGDGNASVWVYGGGRFTGTLNTVATRHGDWFQLDEGGVFAGTLVINANTGFDFRIGAGASVAAALSIPGGNTLTLQMANTPVYAFHEDAPPQLAAGLFADLTLGETTTVNLGANFDGMLWIGGAATDVFLNNADVDFASFDWNGSIIDGSSFEHRLMAYGDGANGTIVGTLDALNVADGYSVSFEQRAGGRELWFVATSSAIPEPASAAALCGLLSAGFAGLRRRRR